MDADVNKRPPRKRRTICIVHICDAIFTGRQWGNNPELFDRCLASNNSSHIKKNKEKSKSISGTPDSDTKGRQIQPERRRIRHVCPECGISFLYSRSFQKHLGCHNLGKLSNVALSQTNNHSGEKVFSCNVCEKTFFTIGSLNAHAIIHGGERKYTCNDCGKSFRTKYNLKKHINIHTGALKFPCCECRKTFTSKYNLQCHIKIHEGKRDFVCYACGRAFYYKNDLLRHERHHKGEKMFFCDLCGKGFTRKHKLKRHLLLHMGEVKFTCAECKMGFVRKRNLVNHKCIDTAK